MKPFWTTLLALYHTTRGRTARPASVAFNSVKTLVQAILMGVIFLGCGGWLVWQIETILMRVIGFVWRSQSHSGHCWGTILFVSGWILAWASAVFIVWHGDGTPLPLDCPNRLVIVGPYRWLRNPMAVGSLTQGLGLALWFASPLIAMYVVCGATLWNVMVRPWEERDLAQRFGAQFHHYQTHVRCWIPRGTPYSPPRP